MHPSANFSPGKEKDCGTWKNCCLFYIFARLVYCTPVNCVYLFGMRYVKCFRNNRHYLHDLANSTREYSQIFNERANDKSVFMLLEIQGGSRNFERPNVERPKFRNLQIANVKSYERSSYSIVLFTKLFFYFF